MIVLIADDLMMSSTISAAVQQSGGTFRFVKSTQRARAKLEGNDCELLLVDLQTPELDWEDLESLLNEVGASIGYAQHVRVDLFEQAKSHSFDRVITRGQMHSGAGEIIAGV